MIDLTTRFARGATGLETEAERQREWFIKARYDHRQRIQVEQDRQDDIVVAAAETAIDMATEQRIEAFRSRLDGYDAATIEAIRLNDQQLDAVRARIDDMLARAYQLPDGRRVFKTEDGAQVFDEHGIELGPDELDPDMIGPDRPTWEGFRDSKMEAEALQAERDELEAFQHHLDESRARIDDGEIATDELDALDAELADLMPPSVARGFNGSPDLPAPQPAASVAAPNLVIGSVPGTVSWTP